MVNSNEFGSTGATGSLTKGDALTSYNVEDFPVPVGRDEIWRFIALRKLRGLHNGEFSQAVAQDVAVSTQAGVTAETVAPDDARLGRAGAPGDRVGAQAWTSMPEAQLVTIEPERVVAEPIVVTVTGRGADKTSFGALSFDVGHHAEATIVIKYVGSGTHADNVEFVVGDGAKLTVVVDADWDNDTVHLSNQIVSVGRDATVRHNSAIFGGEIVRISPRVNFTGPGGDAEMVGVYFADAGQYFENRLLVDHSQPNCRSRVFYKGALQGDKNDKHKEARTCWVGDVLIRNNATGTDTYETNNNLILTDGARADAIPNLEIETGEVAGAGHAATVGRFDDMEVFYLMSRGIPAAEARRLIIRGFFSEVISRIPVESLREEFESRVGEELARINA